MAPFWSDVDIRLFGRIQYEVHTIADGVQGSIDLIAQVNNYIYNSTETTFEGTWMLVALWDEVHPHNGFFPGPEVRN